MILSTASTEFIRTFSPQAQSKAILRKMREIKVLIFVGHGPTGLVVGMGMERHMHIHILDLMNSRRLTFIFFAK